MELSPEERKLVRPYLEARADGGRGWAVGVAVGLLICAGALVLRLVVWPAMGPYFLFVLVLGMVIVEVALEHRRKQALARVIQKYDTALREQGEQGPDQPA